MTRPTYSPAIRRMLFLQRIERRLSSTSATIAALGWSGAICAFMLAVLAVWR